MIRRGSDMQSCHLTAVSTVFAVIVVTFYVSYANAGS